MEDLFPDIEMCVDLFLDAKININDSLWERAVYLLSGLFASEGRITGVKHSKLAASLFAKFLRAGADVSWGDGDGNTPLHILFHHNGRPPVEIVELMLAYGADPDARNDRGVAIVDPVVFLAAHASGVLHEPS